MSTIMSSATIYLAQAATNEPNWLLIGIILGVMVLLALVFLIPRKADAIEDSDKKKSLESDGASKSLEDKSKDELSLSEIKSSKRAAVSEDKTKEELRELRKERRAQTQTEKAIHEREESSSKESDAKEVVAESEVVAASTSSAVEEKSEPEAAVSDSAPSEDVFSGAANDLLAKSDADSSDVFGALFGGSGELNFEEEIGSSSFMNDDNSVIPTLGSALISLDELTRAAEEAVDDKEDDEFAGLSMFSSSSEKKTLN